MNRVRNWLSIGLAAALIAPMAVAPMAARASEEGRRNTALGLGAASAALLLTQKNKLPGLLAAGATVYAYSRYEHDINARHARERRAAYRVGYRRGYHLANYRYAHRRRHHR